MLLERIFLVFAGLGFLAYGATCLFRPETLVDAAGFTLTSDVARVEVQAMYGGLQFAVGAFSLLALIRPALERPALLSLCFLFAGLAGGRLFAVVLASDPGAYNYAALGYEVVSVSVAFALVRGNAKTV